MPAYSYKCDGCGHTTELLIIMGEDKDNQVCPECGYKLTRSWGDGGFTIFGCPNTKGWQNC